MCTTKTPKTGSTDPIYLQNSYLDGGSSATGLSIGRKQLRTTSSSAATQTTAQTAGVVMPSIGIGTRK